MSDLPQGWAEAAVMEIAALHDARRVPLNAKQRADMKGEFPYYGANGLVNHVNDYLFDGHYVLLAEDGGYFDEPARGVAYEARGKFWVNNHAHILEPLGGISPRYLCYQLNAINWMPFVGGSTRLKLTQGGLDRARALVPPIPEQRRIVSKIDSLTGKSRRAGDHLDHIPRLVEKYKQAVLAAAFRGDLTDDRGIHLAPLRTFIQALDQGWSPKCEPEPAGLSEWAVIKTTAIQPVEFLPGENKRLPSHLSPRPEITIQAGDVLITRAGPRSRVAISCFVANDHPQLMLCDKAYRVRVDQLRTDPVYLTYMLNSPQCLNALEAMKTGISDSGLNLTQSKFLELPVPAFSKDVQSRIVDRVRMALNWIDRLSAEATSARRLIDRLDQAVLAKAFCGELVPQDPDDEPASVLLERIRGERAAAPKPRGGRRASTT